ncbi:MAG: glycosyltransferase [Parachlamydiales bacterium]
MKLFQRNTGFVRHRLPEGCCIEVVGAIPPKRILAKADLVVVPTKGMAEVLKGELSAPVVVIPPAVEAKRMAERAGEGKRIGYAGPCGREEGVELLIDALTKLPHVQLEIVGALPKEERRLQAYAARRGVEAHFSAAVTEEIDGFVMPSRSIVANPCQAPLPVLRYASWGRPMILPHSRVILDLLGSPKGALFYKPEDPDDLALCMEHLSHLNLVQKLGEETRRYEGLFSAERRRRAWQEALSRLQRQ